VANLAAAGATLPVRLSLCTPVGGVAYRRPRLTRAAGGDDAAVPCSPAEQQAAAGRGAATPGLQQQQQQQQRRLVRPVRPQDLACGQQLQQQQPQRQQQQQSSLTGAQSSERLLSWRGGRTAAPGPAERRPQQQLPQQHTARSTAPQPLEPSIVGGRAFLTSPVSTVAATTRPGALAGALVAAFAVHPHQLLFAAGAPAATAALRALALARRMLAVQHLRKGADAGSSSSSSSSSSSCVSATAVQPVVQQPPQHDILLQPTLRGRCADGQLGFALDVALSGPLPVAPGVVSVPSPASPPSQCHIDDGDAVAVRSRAPLLLRSRCKLAAPSAAARLIRVGARSDARSTAAALADNMPSWGQAVLLAPGPAAAERALAALALARPLMRAATGQDLAAIVVWQAEAASVEAALAAAAATATGSSSSSGSDEGGIDIRVSALAAASAAGASPALRRSGSRGLHAHGLRIAVFRCVADSFPPALILDEQPSRRAALRAAHWHARRRAALLRSLRRRRAPPDGAL
jgi:stage V sporulation protein SpoVS